MACGCEDCKSCNKGFVAPMSALWSVYDGIGSKASADIVSVAWEREEGKIFRYDLPVPKRLSPQAAREVSHVVERIAKFALWAAGGWKLYLSGPDAVVKPVAKAYSKKGARAFDYDFFSSIYGRNVEATTVHHVWPVEDFPEWAWASWNLISLSTKAHNEMHDRVTDQLTAKGEAWQRRIPPPPSTP